MQPPVLSTCWMPAFTAFDCASRAPVSGGAARVLAEGEAAQAGDAVRVVVVARGVARRSDGVGRLRELVRLRPANRRVVDQRNRPGGRNAVSGAEIWPSWVVCAAVGAATLPGGVGAPKLYSQRLSLTLAHA